jgi:lipoate-protein ligase A
MRFVDNENITDPQVNLALEEHLLRNVNDPDPLLLFYINEPSVIIGRNQNTLEEIDPEFVAAEKIHVVRRLSGGGAVYHDLGNLNFSFITQGKRDLHDFAKFTDPVVKVLGDLGVRAELKGKSDIFAAGKKISGNAQYMAADRMFSHGTLLFDTDIETMLKALNPRQVKIESKAIQSVRNFVTNIRELLPIDMDIQGLKRVLLRGIFGEGSVPTYPLTPDDWEQVSQISESRYRQWDWNYGRSPQFNLQKNEQTPVGKINVHIQIKEGRIEGLKFYGDFAGLRDVAELEKTLAGARYDPEALAAALEGIDLQPYFGPLSKEALVNLLY